MARRRQDSSDDLQRQRDTAGAVERFRQRKSWFATEMARQQANRYQMALDEDYYDSIQWTPDEAAAVRARGQNPIVYNEVKPTIDWLIGTERRMRRDFKVLARNDRSKEATADARIKTQLLKYLDDVNRAPFERSQAADDAWKGGLGVIEVGVRSDPEDELIYVRSESWRNCLYDSLGPKRDGSDWRYFFRFKEVDLDVAIAYFPAKEAELTKAAASFDDTSFTQDWLNGYPLMGPLGDSRLPAKWVQYDSESWVRNPRKRVLLIECWHFRPTRRTTGQGAGMHDRTFMQMHVAIDTEFDTILESESPYRHNRYPFVLLWAYRRKRDGAPYSPIRPVRGPQDDLNKRMSKSLFMLSVNQLRVEAGAIDDEAMPLEQIRDEMAAPDGIPIFANGALSGGKVQVRDHMDIAQGHLALAERDIAAIRSITSVNEENRGLRSGATSRVAMDARADRGSTGTAELVDNLMYAHQLEGELTLSLIELFYTEPSLFEHRVAANRRARELAEDEVFRRRGAVVEQGRLSQQQFKLFAGVPPESLEMFAAAIGAEQAEVYQAYLRLTKNNHSALKRLIHRKGTAGFSQDVPRVLAAFVTSNARLAAAALNLPGARQAAQGIRAGDVKDEAIELIDTASQPTETAAWARGLLFMNFVGGSIASAFVNLTQPVTMTAPYLSQWGGMGRAARRLLAAGRMAASGRVDDVQLRQALARAEREGIVSPQEIHHLTAQAMGTWGTHPVLRKAAFIWGSGFSLAEQFNRRVTFLAAYETARAEGMDDPFGFAQRAVVETQGLYNRANAPNWARQPVGAVALTFKQFSIHYVEWLGRMWRQGPAGRRAVAWALVVLLVAAGAEGLPFAEDLDDLVDTLAQALGLDFASARAKREFVADTLGLGEEVAEVFARGLSSLPGLPIDVSMRLSLGNLVPASGLFLRSNTDRSREVLEMAGAAGAAAQQVIRAGEQVLRGEGVGALRAIAPVAVQNAAKGLEIWSTGEYRDTRGRKVMQADALDGLMKALGFQPAAVARESQRLGMELRRVQLVKNVEAEIADAWARGLVDEDPQAVQAAQQRLA